MIENKKRKISFPEASVEFSAVNMQFKETAGAECEIRDGNKRQYCAQFIDKTIKQTKNNIV